MQIMVKTISKIVCLYFITLALSSNVTADPSLMVDTSKTSTQCSVLDRSDAVIIMVCTTQDAETWQKAGKEACGLKQLCNAWIWDDEAKAPKVAPATDADIPKVNSSQAVAIWVNDSKMLMTVRQVKK